MRQLFISIHALREEGDNAPFFANSLLELFLSTPSARRATPEITRIVGSVDISIHALREEGDGGNDMEFKNADISIHALREEGDTTPSPLR